MTRYLAQLILKKLNLIPGTVFTVSPSLPNSSGSALLVVITSRRSYYIYDHFPGSYIGVEPNKFFEYISKEVVISVNMFFISLEHSEQLSYLYYDPVDVAIFFESKKNNISVIYTFEKTSFILDFLNVEDQLKEQEVVRKAFMAHNVNDTNIELSYTTDFDILYYNKLLQDQKDSLFGVLSMHQLKYMFGSIDLKGDSVEQIDQIYEFLNIKLRRIDHLILCGSHWRDCKLYFWLAFSAVVDLDINIDVTIIWYDSVNLERFIKQYFEHVFFSRINYYYLSIYDMSNRELIDGIFRIIALRLGYGGFYDLFFLNFSYTWEQLLNPDSKDLQEMEELKQRIKIAIDSKIPKYEYYAWWEDFLRYSALLDPGLESVYPKSSYVIGIHDPFFFRFTSWLLLPPRIYKFKSIACRCNAC